MMEKGEHIKGIPIELQLLLEKDIEAKNFFEKLTGSYRMGYCDWVGSAKQEATRQVRAARENNSTK